MQCLCYYATEGQFEKFTGRDTECDSMDPSIKTKFDIQNTKHLRKVGEYRSQNFVEKNNKIRKLDQVKQYSVSRTFS